MTQPVHTPGPVKTHNPAEGCKNDGLYWQILQSTKDSIGARTIIASDMSRDDCRLLAAAYNAFDSAAKRLNCNAVELAERMHDGGIAELVIALNMTLPFVQPPVEITPTRVRSNHASLAHGKAEAILAKVKGAAT